MISSVFSFVSEQIGDFVVNAIGSDTNKAPSTSTSQPAKPIKRPKNDSKLKRARSLEPSASLSHRRKAKSPPPHRPKPVDRGGSATPVLRKKPSVIMPGSLFARSPSPTASEAPPQDEKHVRFDSTVVSPPVRRVAPRKSEEPQAGPSRLRLQAQTPRPARAAPVHDPSESTSEEDSEPYPRPSSSSKGKGKQVEAPRPRSASVDRPVRRREPEQEEEDSVDSVVDDESQLKIQQLEKEVRRLKNQLSQHIAPPPPKLLPTTRPRTTKPLNRLPQSGFRVPTALPPLKGDPLLLAVRASLRPTQPPESIPSARPAQVILPPGNMANFLHEIKTHRLKKVNGTFDDSDIVELSPPVRGVKRHRNSLDDGLLRQWSGSQPPSSQSQASTSSAGRTTSDLTPSLCSDNGGDLEDIDPSTPPSTQGQPPDIMAEDEVFSQRDPLPGKTQHAAIRVLPSYVDTERSFSTVRSKALVEDAMLRRTPSIASSFTSEASSRRPHVRRGGILPPSDPEDDDDDDDPLAMPSFSPTPPRSRDRKSKSRASSGTLAEELARADSSYEGSYEDIDSGVLTGVGTRSKRLGFLAHGGAGGEPVFMGEGYVEYDQQADDEDEWTAAPARKRARR